LQPRTPAVADTATTLPAVDATAPEGHARKLTGKVIKVVTDMGFDDWGAFAVLKAAGDEPTAALVTKGMMQPSNFGQKFASLLGSWGFSTTVHMGTEKCYDQPSGCIADTSFIDADWEYPQNVGKHFDNATGSETSTGKVQPQKDFWDCTKTGPYTLLVLSPISDVATWLSDNNDTAKCIEQIVFSGGFFNTNGEVSETTDNSTYQALVATLDNKTLVEPGVHLAELNVVADRKAMDFVLNFGIKITMIPIEVESIDRVGKEASPDPSNQTSETTKKTDELKKALPQEGDAAMLQKMADIHASGGDVATLDLDAIVATYLTKWNNLFTEDGAKVKVLENGVTHKCHTDDSSCVNVVLGTNFDATGWYEQMMSLR